MSKIRALLALPADLAAAPFDGGTLADHLNRLCASAGLTAGLDGGRRVVPPLVALDGRYPALAADTLHILVDSLGEGGAAAIHMGSGEVIATAVPAGAAAMTAADALAWSGFPTTVTVMPPHGHHVTDLLDLSRAEALVRQARIDALIRAGVRVVDPARVVIEASVRIASGAVLWPDVVLRGATAIGAEAEIQSGCWLTDTVVGERAVLKPHSVCDGANIGEACAVGPMAHLRPGTVLEASVKIGNFVEVKKSVLRRGAKASHLAYVGDAEVGEDANIGAGAITCNYDGFAKHRTRIGARAFIGSNCALVAPIDIGDDAIVGAGSSLNRDVPADALAVERGAVRVLEGKAGAIRRRNRHRAGAAKGG